MQINKALILCAGSGSRMRPYTKIVPKELLPILNHPSIDFIIQECKNSGISQICFVLRQEKEILKKYLTEQNFSFDYCFTEQGKKYGTAQAVLSAKEFIGTDDFAVIFPDEICFSQETPLKSLVDHFYDDNECSLACKKVRKKDTNKYGILSLEKKHGDKSFLIKDLIEKPEKDPPSLYAVGGRFVFKNSFLPYLSYCEEKNGEYFLTDAIMMYAKKDIFYAITELPKTFDTGTPSAYYSAIRAYVNRQRIIFKKKDIL